MLCVNLIFNLLMSPAHAQIDLHAHLHMKPGMGHFLQGTFAEPPRAAHWSDRIFTKVSGTSLAEMTPETRPKLIVISLYSHPYLAYSFKEDGLNFDRKKNVRRGIEHEYQEFIQFIDAHSDRFAIAKNAEEARKILKTGKTVIVLSIEGAWAALETPEDYHRWIEERGLAIVTPVHLTPDSLGGNALMTVVVSIFNSTFDFFKSVWSTRGSCLKNFCKSVEGFTPEGDTVVEELMKRNVWIDLAHSNDLEIAVLIEKHRTRKLPILITHTQLREFYPVERGLGNLEIDYIRNHDGIIGLLPSQYMMPAALTEAKRDALASHPEEANAPSAASGLTCISGLDVFKKTVAYAIATLGAPERVALSSDINAPLDGLSPGCGELVTKNGTSMNAAQLDLHRRGFYTYSQWNVLTQFMSPEPKWSDRSLEHFLILWEKIRPSKTTSSKRPL